PYIYQGEELGMTNAHFTRLEQYQDIESLEAYHQFVDVEHLVDHDTMMRYLATESRDNARTPMQWDATAKGGFTEGTPWLELNTNHDEINVDAELNDPDSVLRFYQRLIELRHNNDLIVYGNYIELDPEDDEVFAYKRQYEGRTMLVLSNFTDQTVTRDYPVPVDGGLMISNYQDDQGATLRPYEAKAFMVA
ncbi:MAG: alpha-glucosidase C-terminal domain-containing protein, partial [Bifidobacterium crudilactis]|nr:alpha-glucosidase C-terminal domain-containing protein [Bifidobacterium crudilactis]